VRGEERRGRGEGGGEHWCGRYDDSDVIVVDSALTLGINASVSSTPLSSLRVDRVVAAQQPDGENADDHHGGGGGGAADPDAHRGHHPHVSPQTQEQEAGEGAHCEEVCGSSLFLLFNDLNQDEMKP